LKIKKVKKEAVVVIPVYKTELSNFERVSLERISKVLSGNYDVVVVKPEKIRKTFMPKKLKNVVDCFESFKNSFFESKNSYNNLMRDRSFYERFGRYKYILVAQTDSYIFEDELGKWCKKDFDYIGAPWVYEKYGRKFLGGVGNGGLSLRKVDSMVEIINRLNRYDLKNVKRILSSKSTLINIINYYANNRNLINKKLYPKRYSQNEDKFWGICVKDIFDWFSVPKAKEALKFSFDVCPSYLYKMNNRGLPFGCHGWWKNEPEFWSRKIPELKDR